MKRHVVLGTAGHIDHGKTALVKALTGMDTDRLIEEKERGMTIDLGFAYLGETVTIIDVPGHEKFVRNMVAGVSTIDMVLFVIAADDSVMPQTIEHLEILNLLQIQNGIIVLTKIDLVEPEWIDLVEAEIQELVADTVLENAPIIRVSSVTQQGIPELRQTINQFIETLPPRQDRGIFRLPIDRVFSMKGFGTVVAGTVLAGTVKADQMVELLPHQKKYRIRGLQIHGKPVQQVQIGDRAAINLVGIEKDQIARGDVLADPDIYQPAIFFDTQLYLLKTAPKPLKYNARVRLHIGTSELLARVRLLDVETLQPGQFALAQLHCENPIVAEVHDRFVLRRYSPLTTIGGGIILQVNPPRHKRFAPEVIQKLKILITGNIFDIVEQSVQKGKSIFKSIDEVAKATNLRPTDLQPILDDLVRNGKIKIFLKKTRPFAAHIFPLNQLKQDILQILEKFHQENPLKQGVLMNEMLSLLNQKLDPFFLNVFIQELQQQGEVNFSNERISLSQYQIELTPEQQSLIEAIEQYFDAQKLAPPHTNEIVSHFKTRSANIEKIIAYLLEQKVVVYIDEGFLLHQRWVAYARDLIVEHFKNNTELSISDFRTQLNTSRKYAVPLLNYFDQQGLTVRQGDVRVWGSE